jgi:hypothetical protein
MIAPVRLPTLILIAGKGRPGPRGHRGTSLGYVPPEAMKKYSSSKPLFRPKPRHPSR